jgi:hypothetical protein
MTLICPFPTLHRDIHYTSVPFETQKEDIFLHLPFRGPASFTSISSADLLLPNECESMEGPHLGHPIPA